MLYKESLWLVERTAEPPDVRSSLSSSADSTPPLWNLNPTEAGFQQRRELEGTIALGGVGRIGVVPS